ncbi:MAG TPA: ABC transporter substrate-binding protein [Woeseiaceae bacterium]|nr:ABC transporter substrate-binding protein [Woeseiaceae bacterium]
MRLILALAGCFAGLACFAVAAASPATRVVSLDYCADQYVLELLPRAHVLALSPDAEQEYAYLRERAAGLPKVRPVAEDVIALAPGLVIRSYGGGPQALGFFERAGIPVVQVPYAETLDDVRAAVRAVADGLGVPVRGAAVVAEMQARLNAVAGAVDDVRSRPAALYLTAGGAAGGPGTLIDEVLAAAGYANYESRPGWHMLSLERLVRAEPDVVVASFFEGATGMTAYWSAVRHPVARRRLEDRPVIALPGALTACGAWFVADAVEILAGAR